MAYQSLYRKYRPQTFADVMGQGHVTRTLQNALVSGRIAHGYLFTGTRGTAKTTVARLLAKALNCLSQPHPVIEPCNICEACVSITGGSAMDVIEMDAASHRGVADVEEVRRSVGFGPMQFRYKVFIIDEAHQLSSDAKDAFLKTLEEPPGNVVFILATTEPQAIPITIRSRCQQFDFKRGSLADIAARLRYVLEQEHVGYTTEAINLVARGAEGSWRDSLSLLEQVLAFAPEKITAGAVDSVLGTLDSEMLARVTEAISRRDAPTAFALAGELLDAGKEARTLLRTLAAHFRDLLLVSVGGPAVSAELTSEEVGKLQGEARLFAPPQMLRAIDILNEAQGETRWNNQHRLLVEMAFLKLMTLGDPGAAGAFVTAPIVFASAERAIQPKLEGVPPAFVPPPIPVPTAPVVPAPATMPAAATAPPIASAPTVPMPAPVDDSADDDTLPSSYFADSEDADEDDIEAAPEADDTETEEVAPNLPLSVATDEPSEDDTLEEDTGPSLFDVMDAPEIPPVAGATALPPIAAPANVPLANAPLTNAPLTNAPLTALSVPIQYTPDVATVPAPEIPPAAPVLLETEDDPLTLEAVQEVWHHFQQELDRRSKTLSLKFIGVQPASLNGGTVTLLFPTRPNYEMMEMSKEKQEWVSKLLAKCMGRDSVRIRLALDASATSAPKRGANTAAKSRGDRLDLLEDVEPREPGGSLSTPPMEQTVPRPAATAPRAAFEPIAVAQPQSVAVGGDFEDPLVQEALSIFGGEIVHEER